MRLADLGTRPRRLVAVAGALTVLSTALLLAGCGGPQGVSAGPRAAAVPGGGAERAGEAGPSASASAPASMKPGGPSGSGAASNAGATTDQPSLPPGDPGLDAPSVPDPGTRGLDSHDHGQARRTVPAAAMLTAGTVRMALGGGWTDRPADVDTCLRPRKAVGTRDVAYAGQSGDLVAQTVATYDGAADADRAVVALGRAAGDCGWSAAADPRLGSASVAATRGDRTMVAVSAEEGVVVLLVGTGDAVRDTGRWDTLVDLAVGSACPAAPDGCH